MKDKCIYLDHHATTPMDERVFMKMKPFFLEEFGNPSSTSHGFGWRALEAVNEARFKMARAINARPEEIIFTSGATESTNMALKGLFFPKKKTARKKIICSSIEHPATLASVFALGQFGLETIIIKPDEAGLISYEKLEKIIDDQTALLSLFAVNNEVGSINDIKAIAALCKKLGVIFHCDAAQALGRIKLDCEELGVDMMSLSGHKIYGPKGVGALFIRQELIDSLAALLSGGGQEWGMRSGTLNVPGIVGMAEATELATSHLHEEVNRIKGLRDKLWDTFQALPEVFLNGSFDNRVVGNLNISFRGVDGEDLVYSICNEVAVSTGSACSGGRSKVLEELGLSPERRQSAIRFGLGRTTTGEEIARAAEIIVQAVKKLRQKNRKKLMSFKS